MFIFMFILLLALVVSPGLSLAYEEQLTYDNSAEVISLDALTRVSFKPYGNNQANHSGLYKDTNGTQWIVKPLMKEYTLKHLWSEYIASRLLEVLVPDQTARVIVLAKESTFLSGSRVIDNFTMEAMLPDDSIIGLAEGKEKLCAALIFVGEGDNNDENSGYVITPDVMNPEKVLAVQVDYDHCFKKFDDHEYTCPNVSYNPNHKAVAQACYKLAHFSFKKIKAVIDSAWAFLESNLPKPDDTQFTKEWLLEGLARQKTKIRTLAIFHGLLQTSVTENLEKFTHYVHEHDIKNILPTKLKEKLVRELLKKDQPAMAAYTKAHIL